MAVLQPLYFAPKKPQTSLFNDFSGGMHPDLKKCLCGDEMSGEDSSLGEIFYPQRCNQRGKIILEREFLLAEMKSARENHPWERIFAGRDEISGKESSPEENSYWQG